MKYRNGIGYDIHPLAEGRTLVLGGVEIPCEKGLVGHSDADVLVHAVCDAILGALGKGDIGEHFPDTDQKYKGISSMILLGEVNNLLREEGYTINNIDTIIQAEEPNLKKYKADMRANIAVELSIDESAVNIKATTMEGLGPVGNKNAIAAFASVLLLRERK